LAPGASDGTKRKRALTAEKVVGMLKSPLNLTH
jgi:hypothetical protein